MQLARSKSFPVALQLPRSGGLVLYPQATDEATPACPPVPTLLATRLQLELLLGERSIDLCTAAGIIHNDLGATLEIFRLAGEEAGGSNRIEDCLASLGTDVWMEAVCGNAVERVARNSAELAELIAFWEHARLIAYACWLMAAHEEGVCPEEAYLVGLLHEAAKLPRLLGWSARPDGSFGSRVSKDTIHHFHGTSSSSGQDSGSIDESFPAMDQLAMHWRLPEYLQAIVASPDPPSCWTSLLSEAHAWSAREDCLLGCTA